MSAIIREATKSPALPGPPILPGALSSIHQQAAPIRIRSMTRIPWGRQNLVPEIRPTVAQIVVSDPLFDQSAVEAVRQWRYRPTVLNGQRVEIDTYITVIYTMQH